MKDKDIEKQIKSYEELRNVAKYFNIAGSFKKYNKLIEDLKSKLD